MTTETTAPTASTSAPEDSAQSQSTQQSTSSSEPAQAQETQGAQTSEPWYSSLPDDLKANPSITKFTSVHELAKGYVNAASLIGRDKIPMPKTDDEMHEVQIRLGKPQSPQEYKIGPEIGPSWVLGDLAESPEPDVPLEEWKACYKRRAHEFGLTQNQAAKVYEVLVRERAEETKKANASIEAELAKCEQELKKVWGEQHDVNLIVASKTAHGLFGENVMKKITAAGLARDPDFIKGLHRIGNRSLEELGIDKRGSSLKTPSDLDGEIAALRGHPAYLDKKHPEHTIVSNKLQALYSRRYPE